MTIVRGKQIIPVLDRVFNRCEINDCWLFQGALDGKGYGLIKLDGSRVDRTHRVVWQELVGVIPDGMQIDHLCRVRSCCNPDHLEVVTPAENNRRIPKHGKRTSHPPEILRPTTERCY